VPTAARVTRATGVYGPDRMDPAGQDDASETATSILESLPPSDPNQDEKSLSEDEEDDQFSEDLYTAINYNTINSLSALKEILATGDTENVVDSSWFQYHFLRHVNRLPSRSNYTPAWSPWEGNRRRLSECKEEDEEAEEKGEVREEVASPAPSQASATPMTPSTPSSRPTTPTNATPLRRRFASVGNVGRESPGKCIFLRVMIIVPKRIKTRLRSVLSRNQIDFNYYLQGGVLLVPYVTHQ